MFDMVKKILSSFLAVCMLIVAGCVLDDDGGGGERYHKVTGGIFDQTNFGIDKVSITLVGQSGEGEDAVNVSRRVFTDTMGSYTFEYIKDGNYRITPYKTNYSFYPESMEAVVSGGSVAINPFLASYSGSDEGNPEDGYSVTGTIVDTYGNGISEIRVALSGEDLSRLTRTDNSGAFVFTNIPNGKYRLAPGSERYRFLPLYASIFVRGHKVLVDSFVALPPEPDGGGTEVSAGTHRYYPVKVNASWTMTVTEADSIRGDTHVFHKTITVPGTEEIFMNDYWTFVDDAGEIDSYVRVEGDIVYILSEFFDKDAAENDGTSFRRAAGSARHAAAADGDPTKEELPYIRFDVGPGESYDIMTYESPIIGMYFYLSWTGKYVGTEDITVIAGTFEECRKYEIVYDAYGVGGGSSQRDTTVTTIWFAPDVGKVKLTEKTTGNGIVLWERTEELVGYSIP